MDHDNSPLPKAKKVLPESYSVLIIEDDPDDILIYQEVFRELYPSIGLRFWSNHKEVSTGLLAMMDGSGPEIPRLIILDAHLPGTSAIETLKAIQQVSHLSSVPVIVISGSLTPIDQKNYSMLGVARCVEKPNTEGELRTIVSEIIDADGNTNR